MSRPFRLVRLATLVVGVLGRLAANAGAQVSYSRAIEFSGYTWFVKSSSEPAGPGPNQFSADDPSVRVDQRGRLHLRIRKEGGVWTCAEVVLQPSLGYGTYRFYLDRPVHKLDPNAVLGLFTWNGDAPAFANREIDIEFSRWSDGNDPTNAQYVVQPYDIPGNLIRFTEPPRASRSIHSFRWTPGQLSFESRRRNGSLTPLPEVQIAQWTTTQLIPQPGGEQVRMNLWLFRGAAPQRNHSVEVVVRRFEFVPDS